MQGQHPLREGASGQRRTGGETVHEHVVFIAGVGGAEWL
jgi:hypothetical protein